MGKDGGRESSECAAIIRTPGPQRQDASESTSEVVPNAMNEEGRARMRLRERAERQRPALLRLCDFRPF